MSAGLRFVDADLVGRITTGTAQTSLTSDDAAALPRPQGTEVLDAEPEGTGSAGGGAGCSCASTGCGARSEPELKRRRRRTALGEGGRRRR